MDRRTLRALAPILMLLIVALAVRVIALGGKGHPADIAELTRWATGMAAYGPLEFYGKVDGANYPAVLYLLWPLAKVFPGEALPTAVKAISIPFDLALGVLLCAVVIRMASSAQATLAAALYLLNPAAIIAGSYWGQLDALGTLPFVGALVALGVRRPVSASALGALAALIKPQFGLVLVVVFAVLMIELYRDRKWRPLAGSLAAGALMLGAVAIPFRLSPGDLTGTLRETAERFPYGSLYALNPWGLLTGFFQPDHYTTAGAVLLAIGLALSVLPLWWRRDPAAILAAGALVTFAFYFLPTRVHERYLYPSIAVLAVFAATRRPLLIPYVVLSACFTYGLVFALWSNSSSTFPLPAWIASTVLSLYGVAATAIVIMGTAVLIVWRLAQDLKGAGSRDVQARSRSGRAAGT